MIRSRITLIFLTVLLFLSSIVNAQEQHAQFEIGSKTIPFSIQEKLSVWRTVSDTVIKCEGNKFKPFGLVPHTEYMIIPKSEFKSLHREFFNEHGCTWTRLTNDVIRKEDDSEGMRKIFPDGEGVRQTFTFLYDSVNVVVRPRSCWRIDTVMQINAITLEEEQVVDIDSESRVKINLGRIAKQELADAIQNQFGLGKSSLNLHLKEFQIWILNEPCDWVNIDYRKAASLEAAKKKIKDIKTGSKIILEKIRLENTSGRNFEDDLYEFAVMTLVD